MPQILIETEIDAPIERVFDLSVSIDLHQISTAHTSETAIAGTTSGFIGKGEWVTWRARHFGIYQELTSLVTEYDRPYFFADEMQKGTFDSFRHEHRLVHKNGIILMSDFFDYRSPFGILGELADRLFLEKYMTKLLIRRNQTICEYAESEKWRSIAGMENRS